MSVNSLYIQATFDGELVEPCVRQQEAMDALRAEISLLDDPDKATRELEEFAQFSDDVKNKRNRLCAAADWAKRCVWVCVWGGGCGGMWWIFIVEAHLFTYIRIMYRCSV